MTRVAQDRYLLWIFGNAAPTLGSQEVSQRRSRSSSKSQSRSRSRRSSDDAESYPPEGHIECTSTSSSEALTALSVFFATAAGEHISSSDTDDEHMENELTSRSAAEATSSSSEIEPLVDTDTMPGANQRRKASTAQRGYQKRRQT